MTPAAFRRLALALPDATEGAHGGAADVRVGGHVFATLAHVAQGYGNLMLTPEQQATFVSESPNLFLPVAGGWARGGATHIRLEPVTEDVLAATLHTAWKLRVEKNIRARKPKLTNESSLKRPARS